MIAIDGYSDWSSTGPVHPSGSPHRNSDLVHSGSSEFLTASRSGCSGGALSPVPMRAMRFR